MKYPHFLWRTQPELNRYSNCIHISSKTRYEDSGQFHNSYFQRHKAPTNQYNRHTKHNSQTNPDSKNTQYSTRKNQANNTGKGKILTSKAEYKEPNKPKKHYHMERKRLENRGRRRRSGGLLLEIVAASFLENSLYNFIIHFGDTQKKNWSRNSIPQYKLCFTSPTYPPCLDCWLAFACESERNLCSN